MKRLIATLCVAFAVSSASAYTPNKIVVPDVEGYKTLKCDFHLHTVCNAVGENCSHIVQVVNLESKFKFHISSVKGFLLPL